MATVADHDTDAFLAAAFASPADPAPLLVLADALDDAGDPRAGRLRALCRVRDRAMRLRGPAAGDDDVWAARQRLDAIPGQESAGVLRVLWAAQCVRAARLHDGRRVWELLADDRSRAAVLGAELRCCGLVTDARLRELHVGGVAAVEDAYAAAAAADAAAYAAYAAAAAAYAAAAARYKAWREYRLLVLRWAVALAAKVPGWWGAEA